MPEPAQKRGRSKQDYATPQAFVDAVKDRLWISAFEMDFAASDDNAKAPLFWGERTDALSQPREDWRTAVGDGWGWLNPPYAEIAPWAERCAMLREDGGRVAFLVPAGVGANWYRDHVHGKALVVALNGRLSFDGKAPYPKDCILVLYSPNFPPGFEVWSWRQAAA